ncbi:hypothetical protein M3Y94_00691100 [Aphelenchoides besseyi]|nr:hypothetical protein M3Y94_00691100 [Aphelenchoides besseyi]
MVNKFTLWPGQPSDEECPTEKYYSETPDGNVWTRIAFATDSTVKNFQAMIVSDGPVSEYPSYGYYSTPAPTTAHTTTSSTTSSTDSTSTSESNTTVEWTQNTNESSWANETTEIPTTQFPACEDLAKSFSTSISPMIVLFILEIFIHLMLRV